MKRHLGLQTPSCLLLSSPSARKYSTHNNSVLPVDNVLNNRVMTSLDLSDNKLGTLVSPGGWSSTPWGVWKYRHTGTGGKADTKPKGEEFKPEGILALANVIPDMRALLKLDISNNSLYVAGAKALAKALSGNQVMTDLNVACNSLGEERDYMPDTSGIVALANTIKDMGALSMLSLKDNRLLTAEAGKILSDMLTANTVLKELDLSSNHWFDGGWKGDGPGFAQQLAVGIKDNGALSSLSLSKNALLTKDAGKVIGDMLKGNSTLKELDLSSNYSFGAGATDGPGFAQELADGIKDNGAMTSLNLSGNAICKRGKMDGIKAIASALKVSAVILIPVLCPSDQ